MSQQTVVGIAGHSVQHSPASLVYAAAILTPWQILRTRDTSLHHRPHGGGARGVWRKCGENGKRRAVELAGDKIRSVGALC